MVLAKVLPQIWVVVLAGGVSTAVPAQTVVPVHKEPHHHLVFEDSLFRILDVRIPSGDTTGFHLHDAPMAYVSISPASVDAQAPGGRWATASGDTIARMPIGAVSWNETYADAPQVHRVANIDDRLFRLIGVVNRGPGDPDAGGRRLGSAGPVEAQGRFFRSAHRTMEKDATLAWEAYSRPVIAVLVSDGELEITTKAGKTDERDGIGGFLVLTAGDDFTLRNRSPHRITLAFVEAR